MDPRDNNDRLATLTKAMAAGDEQAFREFHARWFPRIFRYALVMMRGDTAAAGDVAQDTLLRIVRHVKRFDDEDGFWCWIARLARSAAADHGRKKSRYRKLLERFSAQPVVEDHQADGGMNIPEIVRRGISEMNDGERELLEGKYAHGLSVRELASRGGMSESAVESRLARARMRLREKMIRILNNDDDENED